MSNNQIPEVMETSGPPEDSPPKAVEEKFEPEKDANVILARGYMPVTYPTDSHDGEVNIGMKTHIKLPSPGQQRAGFCIADRQDLETFLQTYRGRYKRFRAKGGGK